MRRLALAPLLLVALVALPACDSGGPDAIGLTGTWEGLITDGQNAALNSPITLRLTDDGRSVNGSGVVELPDERFEFQVVNGSFVDLQVLLPLRFQQPPFEGTLAGRLTNQDPGVIEGTFSGRGNANGPVEVELVARRVS